MIFSKLWQQLRSKAFREGYVEAQAKRAIPFQIRAIMEAKGMSQTELAAKSGLTQGVISRAANPAYGNLTLNTIVRIAAGLDVAFVGRFVPFSKLVEHFDHLDDPSLAQIPTFEEEDESLSGIDKPAAKVLRFDRSPDLKFKVNQAGTDYRYVQAPLKEMTYGT